MHPCRPASDALAVASAEEALAQAHVDLALNVIDDLLHPDYIAIQPGGVVEARQAVLDSYRSGTRHWDSASVDELDVRVYDGAAVVIGRWTASGRNGAQAFCYQARFLSVWARQQGQWRNVAYQSTEITPEAGQ